MRILLADDAAIPACALREDLELRGHKVVLARDGCEAIESLQSEDFDCAYLDVMMPYVDGFEVLRWIREHPTKRGMWVASMTAMANEIDDATRTAIGVDPFVPKPIDVRALFPAT